MRWDTLYAMPVAKAEIMASGELGFVVERMSGEVELIIALGCLQEVANASAVGAGCRRR